MNFLKKGDTVLFQGDSITDSGRRDTGDGMGSGYAAMASGMANSLHPELGLKFLNRGIGGDRTVELLSRWKEDCEDVGASVLSIKIGVNDVWRILGPWEGQTYVAPEEYLANYRVLLDRALASGISRVIVCSPTTIENNSNARVADLLAERVEIVKALSKEYKALYVPFAECQLESIASRPDVAWTLDGCHPSTAGHAALALCWLKTVGLVRD